MYEIFLYRWLKEAKPLKLIFFSFFLVVFLGILNIFFLGNNSLVYVALVSMALYFPFILHLQDIGRDENRRAYDCDRSFFYRYEREMILFLSVFFGALLGFYLLSVFFPFNFECQQNMIEKVKGGFGMYGHFVEGGEFLPIFLNNVKVLFITFFISLFIFSGFVFVLMCNASVMGYYLASFGSLRESVYNFLLIVVHSFLEFGGYILGGLAGTLLAYRTDLDKPFNFRIDKFYLKDVLILLLMGFIFVFLGSVIEVL